MRRVYGDFAKPQLSPWSRVSVKHSFRTMQQYSFVRGKDSSDMAMAIDAMDLLYLQPDLYGFVLVSSDSDFTGLAQRLREAANT